MDKNCTYKYCFAPDTPCNLGESDFTKCEHWKEGVGSSDSEATKAIDGKGLLPWSSNSLGIVDLEFVAGRTRPTVIGVVGAHDAGKTTLLTVFYLLLSRGRELKDRSFAGSYTFGGWENLAHFLRWQGGQGPQFPPHTSSQSGRLPGLLHMSFRNKDDILEDVLFTDAPGEWFERWAVNKSAPNLDGANWINKNADSFMLFADSKALSGIKRGEARSHLISLAERLSTEAKGRRVAIVWSKSDLQVPDSIRTALNQRFHDLFPDTREFQVSVDHGKESKETTEDSFISLLDWLLTYRRRTDCSPLTLSISRHDDPFLAFRGL